MSKFNAVLAGSLTAMLIGSSAVAFAAPVAEKGGKEHIEQAKNANDCKPLERKFDAAYAKHGGKAGATDAKYQGAQKCDSGDFAGGTLMLQSALDKIHMKN